MRRRLAIMMVSTALVVVLLVGAGVLFLWWIGSADRASAALEERLETGAETLEVVLDDDVVRLLIRPDSNLSSGTRVIVVSDGGRVVSPPMSHRQPGFHGPAHGDPGGLADELESLRLKKGQLDRLRAGETVISPVDNNLVGLKALGSPEDYPDLLGLNNSILALAAVEPTAPIPGQAIAWFALSSLVAMAGALVASTVLARRIVAPIDEIRSTTAELAGGDLSARSSVTGDDEIAELARSVNQMAAELERSKALDQQFLMSVSHDLRTPLTVISGYAEGLEEGAVTDAAAAGTIIGNHAARLERLVTDLLDLARLDANRFSFSTETFDLGITAGRSLAAFAPRAESAGIELTLNNQGEVMVDADPDRVDQIIGNLIDNGLKFASQRLEVTVGADDAWAIVEVADDGPGIDPADLPFVFDRLYVAKAQPERAENPIGLGLSIVRELTNALGGEVTVTNLASGGASFQVRLRLADRVDDLDQ